MLLMIVNRVLPFEVSNLARPKLLLGDPQVASPRCLDGSIDRWMDGWMDRYLILDDTRDTRDRLDLFKLLWIGIRLIDRYIITYILIYTYGHTYVHIYIYVYTPIHIRTPINIFVYTCFYNSHVTYLNG